MNENYVVEQEQGEDKRRKKKILLILLCLLLTIVMLFGLMFAFFSDVISGGTDVTAGTLDIVKGTETIKQNGIKVEDLGNGNSLVENLNPGDVVTVSVPVSNKGSKSAWLKGKFTLKGSGPEQAHIGGESLPIYLFAGERDNAYAEANKNNSAVTIPLSDNGDGTFSFAEDDTSVIEGNSTLPDYEKEDSSTVPSGTSVLPASGQTLTYTLYFDEEAGNAWQDKVVDLDYIVQAIQYRNNPSPDWRDVVEIPFGS